MIGTIYVTSLFIALIAVYTKPGYYQQRKRPDKSLRLKMYRKYSTYKEKIKLYGNREKWRHERYRAQIKMKDNPKVIISIFSFLLLFSIISLIYFVNPIIGLSFGLIPLGMAAVTPKELLNTGIVSAEDWAEETGNHTDVEIQNALDFARENSKGAVHLGSSEWTINDEISINLNPGPSDYSGIHILGSSMNTTRLTSAINDNAKYVFRNEYDAGTPTARVQLLYFSDFRINGDAVTAGAILGQYVSEGSAGGFFAEKLEIHDFDNSQSNGIRLDFTNRSGFSDINTYNCYYGLHISNTNSSIIYNCRTMSGESGIRIYAGLGNTVISNTTDSNNNVGIIIIRSNSNLIQANNFEDNNNYGIFIDRDNIANECDRNVIAYNLFFGNSNTIYGIYTNGSFTNIYDNEFSDHTTGSISIDHIGDAWDKEWNQIGDNYSEDSLYVFVGSTQVFHTVIKDKKYIDGITDNGDYTIWPDNEYAIVKNNNPLSYFYVGSEDAQILLNSVGHLAGQCITITQPIIVTQVIFTLRNHDANTTYSVQGKIYAASGTPGTDGVNTGAALATSTNTINGAAIAPSGGAGTQQTFTFEPYILQPGNYCFGVEVSAYTNGGCHVRDDNTGSTGAGNLFYDKGTPTPAPTADCYNWELFDATGLSTTMTFGDVVIIDEAGDDLVKHTTSAASGKVAGIVYDNTTSQGDELVMLTKGRISKVKVNGTVDIEIGDFLETHTDEGISQNGTIGSGACFAIARGNYSNNDSNGEIEGVLISPR